MNFKKGSFLASFFIPAIFFLCNMANALPNGNHPTSSEITALANDPQWHALLHIEGTKHYIDDENFLLSHNNFSAENELLATINYLYSGVPNSLCRFPARYLLIKNRLDLPTLDISACSELIHFEKKAPAEKISLIFASENLSVPSSMMGHVFIKISGVNDDQKNVEHAISFFTDIKGFNLPKIIYEGVISGKKGYLALSPYRENLFRYNTLESRNVWEFELAIDEFTRRLIQLHFFELKQTALRYYFDDYNCATVTQFVLKVAIAEPQPSSIFGVTPIDTVKYAQSHQLIKSTLLSPSTKWHMRMLSDTLNTAAEKRIKKAILSNDINSLNQIDNSEERFVSLELAEKFNYFLWQSDSAMQEDYKRKEEYEKLRNEITASKSQLTDINIDATNYKSPANKPNDSHVSLGTSIYENKNYLKLSILPSSHKMEDDNRQYFGETELTLGELSISSSPDNGKVFLDRFTLYGVSSLIPRSIFSGGLSGSFHLGTEQQIHQDFTKHSQLYISGALGSTFAVNNDINIYSLFGIGFASSRLDSYAEVNPEIGIIVKEVYDMKSIIKIRHTITNSFEIPDHTEISFIQAFYINFHWALFFEANKIKIQKRDENELSLRVKHYF